MKDKEKESYGPPQELDFNYNEQLAELWGTLRSKVVEKMSDNRKIMSDELRQIQGRHRQFYKIQFTKQWLDKFEPDKVVKEERDAPKSKKGKKSKKPADPGPKFHYLKNFCATRSRLRYDVGKIICF